MRESSSDISLAEVKQAYRMEQSLVGLSLHLSQCLFHENDEIVLETARVLGTLFVNAVLNCLIAFRSICSYHELK